MATVNQRYVLDLPSIFDRAFSDRDREFRSQLRPLLSDPSVKENIGREVILKIQENTANNKDKNGNSFIPSTYSKSYQRSLKFKIYGKSPGDVNLKLTGEMLSNMQQNSVSGPQVVIDFASEEQNAKADGHIRGTGRNNSLPKRDFFGLPKEQEDEILKGIIESAARSGAIFDLGDFLTGVAAVGLAGQIGEDQTLDFDDFLFDSSLFEEEG